MRKKYYFIALLVLAVSILGYHYYAAYQAETQIDEAIQEQLDKTGGVFSVSYTSINVAPFSGNISFKNVSVTDTSNVYRGESLRLDLTYLDFLSIYFRGLEYGLKQLTGAGMTVEQPAYVNRASQQEVTFGSLNLTFKGNAWAALVGLVNAAPMETPLIIRAEGDEFAFHNSKTLPGTIKAERLSSEHVLPDRSNLWWKNNDHRLALNEVVWSPPLPFQKQYGFFIRGFGYETDSIPADSMYLSLTSASVANSALSVEFFTEPFDAEATAQFNVDEHSLADSRLRNGTIRIVEASEDFKVFITNLEQLLGVRLSNRLNEALRFSGTIKNPRFQLFSNSGAEQEGQQEK